MGLCLLWGFNTILFAALAAHPAATLLLKALCGVLAVASWLRGMYWAGHVEIRA